MKSILQIKGVKKLERDTLKNTKGGGPDRPVEVIPCHWDSSPVIMCFDTFYGEICSCVAYTDYD